MLKGGLPGLDCNEISLSFGMAKVGNCCLGCWAVKVTTRLETESIQLVRKVAGTVNRLVALGVTKLTTTFVTSDSAAPPPPPPVAEIIRFVPLSMNVIPVPARNTVARNCVGAAMRPSK